MQIFTIYLFAYLLTCYYPLKHLLGILSQVTPYVKPWLAVAMTALSWESLLYILGEIQPIVLSAVRLGGLPVH